MSIPLIEDHLIQCEIHFVQYEIHLIQIESHFARSGLICDYLSFEYSSLNDFPSKKISYELLRILSRIASATGPFPSFSCHPSGDHCEQNIVDFLFVRFSISSNKSFLSVSLVRDNRNSSIIKRSYLNVSTHLITPRKFQVL